MTLRYCRQMLSFTSNIPHKICTLLCCEIFFRRCFISLCWINLIIYLYSYSFFQWCWRIAILVSRCERNHPERFSAKCMFLGMYCMMTTSKSAFCITGTLRWESRDHWWIPFTRTSNFEVSYVTELNCLTNNRVARDLRSHNICFTEEVTCPMEATAPTQVETPTVSIVDQ